MDGDSTLLKEVALTQELEVFDGPGVVLVFWPFDHALQNTVPWFQELQSALPNRMPQKPR